MFDDILDWPQVKEEEMELSEEEMKTLAEEVFEEPEEEECDCNTNSCAGCGHHYKPKKGTI